MEPDAPKPGRRVRYKGTHPRHFSEKYKEQQPEKYGDDIAKVMSRGQTPAGMHRPIMVQEILGVLAIRPGETGFDATLGYGGHCRAMLEKVRPGGRLFATDVDSIELPKTEARLRAAGFTEKELQVRHMNFAGIDKVSAEAGGFDFVLADLGVSSMQLDTPDRGFSYKTDGPLDLRLNPSKGQPASALLKTLNAQALETLFIDHSDEPYARAISRAIATAVASGKTIETTKQLHELIAAALAILPERHRVEEIKKSSQRVFQALRIEINDEFGVLDRFLEKLPDALKPGARVAILTFHSGEDRRVKKAFQHYQREGVFSAIADEPARPSAKECHDNPRAKPAKLRWAVMV
jgi:16S rRNA (cytosine1402-N4)-methyltransferase